MGTRKTTTVVEQAVGTTYLPNSLPTLRALFIRIDDKGHTVTVDRAILGWVFDTTTPPWPLTVGAAPERSQLVVVRDEHAKTWVNPGTGETFSDWKDVVGPLYADYDKRPKPEPTPEAITAPSIGGVGLASGNWPGQPLPWKAGRS